MDDPRKATAMAGGVVGAIVILLVHVLAFYQIDATPDVVAAVTVLLTAAAGWIVHPASDDLAALHKRILERLDPPPVTRIQGDLR